MTASSMAQLEQMMRKELQKAMTVVSAKVEADMYEEVGKFYTKGTPVMYQRTGQLGNSPATTALTSLGNAVSFEAYLDQSEGYSTGKKPSMTAVLNLTNYGSYPGLRPALGKTGFWERAENKMEKTLNQTMRKYFR
ncbi:MAG: hypothetical protein LUC91_00745 [Prevotella sp.]|nr:hypothetical protein [Prevotella sp.]